MKDLNQKTELVCISCPMGCNMTITKNSDGTFNVTGNTCNRGEEYAQKELTNPTRIVTSTVKVIGGKYPVVSVKTRSDIPKGKIADCMAALKDITLEAPIHIGDIVIENVLGTGVDIVATRKVEV